ncbi:hypothetical protein PMAYCL1PPCAC_20335, partial [Pristionchus mayeri]
QLTKLPSGLIVVSAEHLPRPPLSDHAHLMVMYRAGTRYETNEQRGLACLIKGIVSTEWENVHSELSPASADSESYFGCFLSPDYFGVRISVPRHLSQPALNVLGHFAAFKDWKNLPEISSIAGPRAPPSMRSILSDYVRNVAFSLGSLSHSIRSSRHTARIKYTDALIRHFASTRMVASEAVLYGINVEHEKLCEFGEKHVPGSRVRDPPAPDSRYVGGEWRREVECDSAYVVIAGQGRGGGRCAGYRSAGGA